jgi:hypothetical protein
MRSSLRNRLLARLIEAAPGVFLACKGLPSHPMAADRDFLRLHAQLVRDGEGMQVLEERYNLWRYAQRAAGRPGAFAELGVYRGGSARILCVAKGAASLHLFDTFAGMPAVNRETDGSFSEGDFADGTLEQVRGYLGGFRDVFFHPGVFPASASGLGLDGPVFQFVHLDVDLHQSTLDGLRYFYPRLAAGGILISHDYGDPTVPGVRRAFAEFMRDKPEPLVEIGRTQVMFEKAADS